MPNIRILPDSLKNKIRAGEVIERPASVVKELIENSIDAGSGNIDIEVLRGGKKLISVSDDGSGMEREDALLCLERHSTSKLLSEEGLFNINTMGFRGEALPSIASVSRLKLITGFKGSASGTAVFTEGGIVKEISDAPSNGTTLEVRDLFYNTPARRKFLKAEATETAHIINTITRYCLSYPEISFRVKVEGKDSMNIPKAGSLRERLMQVYGGEFLGGLLDVSRMGGGLKLEGFFSHGKNFRNSKSHQFVFINRRPVKDISVSHALYNAYEGIVPKDRHPIFFIFIDIDPGNVDFNVHPSKQEVRFFDKEAVYRLVLGSVRGALTENKGARAVNSSGVSYPNPGVSIQPVHISEPMELSYSHDVPYIYLGDTFLAFPEDGGITLIDHHAAHERVLYEKFLKGMGLGVFRLLFPKQVKLSHGEWRVLIENKGLLFELGMEIEDFGGDTAVVRSLPEALDEADLRGILMDVAADLQGGIPPGRSIKEAVAAKVACHSSIRGRRILSGSELRSLLDELLKTENPSQCPHGRPTKVHYSLDEIKRIFKRR